MSLAYKQGRCILHAMDPQKAAKDVVYRWYRGKATKESLEKAIARVIRLALRRASRAQ